MNSDLLKPWMLVKLQLHDPERLVVGEVIAYPFQDQVLVRQIPGESLSLIQANVKDIVEEETRKLLYVQTAVLSGRSDFPMDMLRYENCAELDIDEENRTAIVGRVNNVSMKPWSERWASFGWRLVSTECERLERKVRP